SMKPKAICIMNYEDYVLDLRLVFQNLEKELLLSSRTHRADLFFSMYPYIFSPIFLSWLLEASTNNELAQIQPLYDIPSKLSCNVIGNQLNIENYTNELYAEEVGIPIPSSNQENPYNYYFTKVLSASDTSPHGGLSVLKKHALECLPPLNMSHPTPTQEIVAKDLHGREWRFKRIFRGV
ncbi:unnamed protein product, partial [Thlaspi arvense]